MTSLMLLQVIEDRTVALALSRLLPKYSINTPARIAAFLAQTAHESGDFKFKTENLNYSAEALIKTWPKRYTAALAAQHARKPELIANHVYANRMGNSEPGDGYRFRGRGFIQITGKANYLALSRYLGKTLDETIKYLETVDGACEGSCWFWRTNNLNRFAESGDMINLTRAINGGINGLTDRQARLKKILEQLAK